MNNVLGNYMFCEYIDYFIPWMCLLVLLKKGKEEKNLKYNMI